jgi:predicted O-methyltransferase YrrM
MKLFDKIILNISHDNTTMGDLIILHKFAEHRKCIVEIGTAYGIGAMILSSHGSIVHTIDNHTFYLNNIAKTEGEKFKIIRDYLNFYSKGRIHTRYSDSVKAAELFEDESIDLLFIDGGHFYEQICEDYRVWFPKVEKDGVIIFHDVSENTNQVLSFWNNIILKDIENGIIKELVQKVKYESTCKVVVKL